MSVSWRKTVPGSRKRVSRSPYQSSSPDTKKSTANAAVTMAFSFWPALKRPCGTSVWPLRKRRSSRSNRSTSRAVCARARRFPSATIRRIAPAQEIPVQKWTSLTNGRRPTATESDGMYSTSPEPSSTKKALACTQCRSRSVTVNRSTYLEEAVGPPDPGVHVVAALLPVARARPADELDSLDPLDVLVAVHLRDHDAHWSAVLARQRFPVHLVREHHLREPDLLQREVVVVRLFRRNEVERVRPRQRPRLGEEVVEANPAPPNAVHDPAGDAVEGG